MPKLYATFRFLADSLARFYIVFLDKLWLDANDEEDISFGKSRMKIYTNRFRIILL